MDNIQNLHDTIDFLEYQLEQASSMLEQTSDQLAQSRQNDRIAMSWLNDIRSAIDPSHRMGYDEVLEWVTNKAKEGK